MRLRSLLQPRVCLFAMGSLSFAYVLALNHDTPPPPSAGIVWVYHPALCATPGDASDCTPVGGSQGIFDSMDACAVHRSLDLAQASNPRLLGTCARQHEA
jgi:hypothetical protein